MPCGRKNRSQRLEDGGLPHLARSNGRPQAVTQPTATTSKHCAATRKDGRPCSASVAGETAWCFLHDPAREPERAAARRKGGENRADVVRLRGLVPPRLMGVYDRLDRALTEVHDGSLDSRRATAMAAVARAMVSVLTAGELEERVRALEGREA